MADIIVATTNRHKLEEYRRMLAEGNLVSTNYAFCMKQSYFRAQELFTREFKKALDKESAHPLAGPYAAYALWKLGKVECAKKCIDAMFYYASK